MDQFRSLCNNVKAILHISLPIWSWTSLRCIAGTDQVLNEKPFCSRKYGWQDTFAAAKTKTRPKQLANIKIYTWKCVCVNRMFFIEYSLPFIPSIVWNKITEPYHSFRIYKQICFTKFEYPILYSNQTQYFHSNLIFTFKFNICIQAQTFLHLQ